ncbi:hypothetical protein Tco_0021666, partial [Tanacetum coccineum]
DQRHQYLRYEGLQYTDADIADFKTSWLGYTGERFTGFRGKWGGVRRRMSWKEFTLALGLHSAEEMQTVGFGLYWTKSARRIPDKGGSSPIVSLGGGRKQGDMISGGQYVAHLAKHFGLLTEERLPGLTVIAPSLPIIDMTVQEASMAPGGGDEDEEMPQGVPPPPGTQGERIS